MDTEVDVQNPTLTLIPGMYAEVNLHIAESHDALTVPLDAVDRSTAAARVYVVTAGVIHIVPVAVGLETDQSVEILSGLQEGDVVVTGRHAGLRDGQTVQAK
jgi:multidrug efflux pump subunit AcrA (membrane-fusion protein)